MDKSTASRVAVRTYHRVDEDRPRQATRHTLARENFSDQMRALQRAGYRAAFSPRAGFNRRGVNRFRIRRIGVHGTDTPTMWLRKVRLGTSDGRFRQQSRYYLERLWTRLSGSGG